MTFTPKPTPPSAHVQRLVFGFVTSLRQFCNFVGGDTSEQNSDGRFPIVSLQSQTNCLAIADPPRRVKPCIDFAAVSHLRLIRFAKDNLEVLQPPVVVFAILSDH